MSSIARVGNWRRNPPNFFLLLGHLLMDSHILDQIVLVVLELANRAYIDGDATLVAEGMTAVAKHGREVLIVIVTRPTFPAIQIGYHRPLRLLLCLTISLYYVDFKSSAEQTITSASWPISSLRRTTRLLRPI